MEVLLIVEGRRYGVPDSWSEHREERFTDQKLGKLGLPQQCNVKIMVREYVG